MASTGLFNDRSRFVAAWPPLPVSSMTEYSIVSRGLPQLIAVNAVGGQPGKMEVPSRGPAATNFNTMQMITTAHNPGAGLQ